jgi:triosephosphate isomerase
MTGDMLKDFGVGWTLTGHSERRVGFGGQPGESNEVVGRKTALALTAGLSVIDIRRETVENPTPRKMYMPRVRVI